MSINLLAIGDIHLGRRPTRVPEDVLESVGLRELTPAAAWRRAVEKALSLEVDAVLLAGDVVEQNDDFYEAYGDLAEGVERLTGAGARWVKRTHPGLTLDLNQLKYAPGG